ncbi:MAG: NUDIX hydrolase [Patescibacteria group bacterium]
MLSDSIIVKLLDNCRKDGIQKIVAGAVIVFENNKILFLERATGEFKEGLIELPSGGINDDETIIQGLIREVKEETGLNVVSVTDYLGYFDYLSKSGRKTRQFNFKVITEPGEIKINPIEHSHFLISSDLDILNISEEVKKILKK